MTLFVLWNSTKFSISCDDYSEDLHLYLYQKRNLVMRCSGGLFIDTTYAIHVYRVWFRLVLFGFVCAFSAVYVCNPSVIHKLYAKSTINVHRSEQTTCMSVIFLYFLFCFHIPQVNTKKI